MKEFPATRLSQELLKLEKARLGIFRNEARQAAYLMVLARVVNRYVFRYHRWNEYEPIYGRLYLRRRGGMSFVRQLRKDEFETIRPTRVISGYGLRKIERVLLQMLVTAVSTPKRRKSK